MVPSFSASLKATKWFFAPPNATTLLFNPLHLSATILAMGLDPTKETASIFGDCDKRSESHED